MGGAEAAFGIALPDKAEWPRMRASSRLVNAPRTDSANTRIETVERNRGNVVQTLFAAPTPAKFLRLRGRYFSNRQERLE
jgi:hypothetical protein